MAIRMKTQTEQLLDGFMAALDEFYLSHPDLNDCIPEQYRDNHEMRGFYIGCHLAGLLTDNLEGSLRISIARRKARKDEPDNEGGDKG